MIGDDFRQSLSKRQSSSCFTKPIHGTGVPSSYLSQPHGAAAAAMNMCSVFTCVDVQATRDDIAWKTTMVLIPLREDDSATKSLHCGTDVIEAL